MPTIADIFRTLKEHEELEKSAAVKKTAIANPNGGGPGANVQESIDNVLGPNMAETKVRIKSKLEAAAGQAKAVEGLSSNREDEHPASTQQPRLGDKMPPSGDVGAAGKAAAEAAKKEEEKAAEAAAEAAEAEKTAKAMPAAFKAYLAKKKGGKAEKKAEEVAADEEKVAAEKVAAEYYAAGQIMAQGFAHELGRLMVE